MMFLTPRNNPVSNALESTSRFKITGRPNRWRLDNPLHQKLSSSLAWCATLPLTREFEAGAVIESYAFFSKMESHGIEFSVPRVGKTPLREPREGKSPTKERKENVKIGAREKQYKV